MESPAPSKNLETTALHGNALVGTDAGVTPLKVYLRSLGGTCAVLLAGIVLLNLTVDPYRVYHSAWRGLPYPSDPQQLAPGLARHCDYSAVVAGSSHCDNFLPSTLERELGWKALRLTLPGSTIPQQHLAVSTAIESGKVRQVLWGLDLFAFYGGDATIHPAGSEFPAYLYDHSFRTPFMYLLNPSTAEESFRMLAGRGQRELELRGTWFDEHDFSAKTVLNRCGGHLQRAWRRHRRDRLQGWQTVIANFEQRLEPLVQAHPEIDFCFVLPPISGLAYLHEFFDDGDATRGFDVRLQFRRELCERLNRYPNVRLFDFEIADHITHDLDHYMDLTHYGVAINDWMVGEIAANRYHLTPATLARHQQKFQTATLSFCDPVLRGQHEWSTRLELHRYPLALPTPPQWAASDSPSRS